MSTATSMSTWRHALSPNVLGYRDPDVDLAIRRQLTRGIGFSLASDSGPGRPGGTAGQAHSLRAEMVRFGTTAADVVPRRCGSRAQQRDATG